VLSIDLGDSAFVVVDVDLIVQDLIVATFKGGFEGFEFVHGLSGKEGNAIAGIWRQC